MYEHLTINKYFLCFVFQCQSPYIDCRNRPKDVCDRGLCRRCCLDFGRKMGADCYGHILFFTEGDFSDTESVRANC